MTTEFIVILILTLICCALAIWCMCLDSQVEQFKGGIKRIERENNLLRMERNKYKAMVRIKDSWGTEGTWSNEPYSPSKGRYRNE